MKFYIISLLINIGLLFIPIVIPVIEHSENENKKQTINISLSNSFFGNDSQNDSRNGSGSNINEISQNIQSKTDLPQKKQNETQQEKSEARLESKPQVQKQTKESADKKDVLNISNTSNIQNTSSIKKETVNRNSAGNSSAENNMNNTSNGNTAGNGNINGSNSGDNTGGGGKSGGGKGGNQIGSGNNTAAAGTNICREGVGFTVTYNPELPYPAAAQRLGIKDVVRVNVKITVNANGTVNVVSVSGGHPAFHNDAKNAAKKIRINIKNPEAVKCTLTKPFRFNPK